MKHLYLRRISAQNDCNLLCVLPTRAAAHLVSVSTGPKLSIFIFILLCLLANASDLTGQSGMTVRLSGNRENMPPSTIDSQDGGSGLARSNTSLTSLVLAGSTPDSQKTAKGAVDKKQKAMEELPALLRAVFHSKWNEQDVLLTVDAGWRNDSLSVEYKYYKGSNLLSLDENLLVEKIYFTVKPEEIDALETENDEFLFLYLRNTRKLENIRQLSSRPVEKVFEDNWRSSLGFPIREENLPGIIQLLKDLRQAGS